MKLLVVEYEPRIASFLAKGLRAHGYDVAWASTGREALELGVEPGLSLVMLDLRLPDPNGLEVLASLRSREATVPVLILSARERVPDPPHATAHRFPVVLGHRRLPGTPEPAAAALR